MQKNGPLTLLVVYPCPLKRSANLLLARLYTLVQIRERNSSSGRPSTASGHTVWYVECRLVQLQFACFLKAPCAEHCQIPLPQSILPKSHLWVSTARTHLGQMISPAEFACRGARWKRGQDFSSNTWGGCLLQACFTSLVCPHWLPKASTQTSNSQDGHSWSLRWFLQ